MKLLPLATIALFTASGAFAQEVGGMGPKLGQSEVQPPAAKASMGELLSKGYEIKAAVPNGGKFVVFLQKDQSAYACEMKSLTASQCGTLN
ncbi:MULTISPECIES: hypothetical protein [Rhizobium]|jgi:hypothetical protein|uniref:Uncharacterized protein n=1 Tax=Rhizobium altiplani TaxID=1864509 RepID=A0A109JV23_9HYPH|nr:MULTISPECIES: hypothetical protein [Rhizobium]KWV55646.1 hypothetical protein AS026_36995 [Rhizobium altiplani]MBD9453179.1 hypothetical protein [Rhizobium sp. RHZ02]NMN71015.1 hypothetical protein [Rhizobium sp. 57MFTsu3.2]